jgi:hypothetical protein
MPSSCFAFANSTIRIAFFAARPMSMMFPICTYTLLSYPMSQTPKKAPSATSGEPSSTAHGSRQLS